jgi:serine/threonine-protein kinase
MQPTWRDPKSQGTWGEQALSPGDQVADGISGGVYRIVRFMGRGGMGEVYEVLRADSGERFALKCLLLKHADNAKTIERTRREALTLRELRHPNVVRVHATGVREDGLIWMVMDLLVGHTLDRIRRRLGRLPLPWALRIGRAVADGLSAVHAFAVHRDVKPENIHLGEDAVVRVLDLGAGKFHKKRLLTTGGGVLGTVPYMSPEQISGEVDARSDLFSLGVVLVELISGVHPFAQRGLEHENVFSMVDKIVRAAPVSSRGQAPWVPGYIAEVIDRALQPDRERRPASAAALAAELAAALDRLEREVGPGEPLSTLVAELGREEGVPVGPSPFAVTIGAAPTTDADTVEMPPRR